MRIILKLLRLGFVIGLSGVAFLAFAAFLGFASPLLDGLNHLQPFLFTGTLLALIVGVILFRTHPWRAFIMAFASTSFLASAVIVIPEFLSSFTTVQSTQNVQSSIKIMSHNLFGMNSEMDQVAASIEIENPDILVFQEYFSGQWRRLHPLIVEEYPYFSRCAGGRRAFIALYAKWPFELVEGSQCPINILHGNNDLARIVARFDLAPEGSFTAITTHLNWPIQVSPLFTSSLTWPQRITGTYARQKQEMANLSAAVKAISNPVILVGDFNSTPWSYALRRFTAMAGLQRHTRNMLTYPATLYLGAWVPTQPFLPLDHLMSGEGINVLTIKTGAPAGSDHLPLIAEFVVSGRVTPQSGYF